MDAVVPCVDCEEPVYLTVPDLGAALHLYDVRCDRCQALYELGELTGGDL